MDDLCDDAAISTPDTLSDAPGASQAMDAMAELILVRDSQGRILFVNAAFLNAFGGDRPDWIGRWFAVAPALADQGGSRRYDAAMSTRHGPVWIEWSETRAPAGATVAVGRDVTEERRARAEESEAAKGKSIFFAAVTHELRTPLSGALGAASLLSDTRLAPDQRAYLDAVRESAGHALSLIDDILDLTRLEAGRLELNPGPVDLRALIEQAGEVLAPRANEKGLSFSHAVDADVPALLEADAARIKQIVFNLAGNAVKFTETGGVLITVEYADGRLRLAVRDTGPGIAKTDQERLFQHFERGAAEKSGAPGAGLGLAMVKRLAEAMDGEVGVQSEPGEGALFWATLTLPSLEAPPAQSALAGRAVIVAAADRLQREALVRQARALGADAIDAGEAGAALAIAERQSGERPCTVILDAAWVEAAAQEIKQLAPGSRLLALAEPRTKDRFTGADRPENVDGWLVAPVRLASLAAWAAGREQDEPVEPQKAEPSQERPLEGLSILLAEDDPVNAMIARTVLMRLGADVSHVSDGRAAVEAASGGGFDAALLDLRMPGLGGRQAAEQIRARAELAGMAIVALTANATEADRIACLTAGMDDFLTKPVDPDLLAERLTALCAPQKRANVG
jgi:signal transduction histidine kinase/CheY-like chemotaxis protein